MPNKPYPEHVLDKKVKEACIRPSSKKARLEDSYIYFITYKINFLQNIFARAINDVKSVRMYSL